MILKDPNFYGPSAEERCELIMFEKRLCVLKPVTGTAGPLCADAMCGWPAVTDRQTDGQTHRQTALRRVCVQLSPELPAFTSRRAQPI